MCKIQKQTQLEWVSFAAFKNKKVSFWVEFPPPEGTEQNVHGLPMQC